MFYTSVFSRGDNIYMRGYDKGLRCSEVVKYEPYVFVPTIGGPYKTLDGKSMSKLSFSGIKAAREYAQSTPVYGITTFQYLYIFDKFNGEIDYDPRLIRVTSLDIECAADDGFPDIRLADKEITAITLRSRGRSYSFGCGEFTSDDPNVYYLQCVNEQELLLQFLKAWKMMDIDVVTGWNIEMFDIPYLINRIIKLLGEAHAKQLSPWKMINESSVELRGVVNQTYDIHGVSILDYYRLYKKFSFKNQESYKLDYIAQEELGEKKIDYSEHGSLLELYKNDFQKFILYNIHDCALVDRLEDKLKFIELVMALAYSAKVNYEDMYTTVRPWDIIIHNYLLEQGIVVPPVRVNNQITDLVGGYVKDPKVGVNRWVVGFDYDGLYPHLIMMFNISPEMFIERRSRFLSIDELLEGDDTFSDYAHAANGCIYKRERQGFLPALMEKMYNERVKFKKLMIEAKKELERHKTSEGEKLVARYYNMQLARKIQLNSAYGALANMYFRWFSFDNAEAITMSGQLATRWLVKRINEFMNSALKTDGVDYIVAGDTDSLYIEMGDLVAKLETTDKKKITDVVDKFCQLKLQPYIERCCVELAERMCAFQSKLKMKRETISEKGIWLAKKMYILNVWNDEGVQYEKPKLKMVGISAVKSSTPKQCRTAIKEALGIIMNGEQSELQHYVSNFRTKFNAMPFEDVACPLTVSELNKYRDAASMYKKGTPPQVKGSMHFNDLLKKYGLRNIKPIGSGDKIRFAYLKMPNPIQDTVIAAPDDLPKEFGLDEYIDRGRQFEKNFLHPLTSITDIIGWQLEKKSTVESWYA